MKTETFVIEGQDPDGHWLPLSAPFSGDDNDDLGPEGVATQRRTMTIGMLRATGVTRYSRVRIKKTITTEEIVGGHHVV